MFAATQNIGFMAYSGGDPYWANVVLLMHMDNTSFADEKGHTVTPTNSPITEAGAFGNAVRYEESEGRLLTVAGSGSDFDFTANDFTIEFRLKPYSYPTCGGFYLLFMGNYFSVRVTALGAITAGFYKAGYWYTKSTADGVITSSTYNAVAICANGANLLFFVDGELLTTETIPGQDAYSSQAVLVGNSNSSGICDIEAAMDELRITNGVARYTADYTVATSAFPNF